MYQDKQFGQANAIGAVSGYAPTGQPPVTMAALQEASESMDRAISEAMSLGEMLAGRLSVLLAPASPATGGEAKLARSCSPYVETVNYQRARVDAISAQLRDLLGRLEV